MDGNIIDHNVDTVYTYVRDFMVSNDGFYLSGQSGSKPEVKKYGWDLNFQQSLDPITTRRWGRVWYFQ